MAREERERKRQAIEPRRGRTEWRREFTIYTENLPLDMGSQDLRNILRQAGRISDVYIPQRLTRKTRKKFGFVRFWKVEEAEKCIYMFNNQFLRGKKIMANWVKFSKHSNYNRRIGSDMRQRPSWRNMQSLTSNKWVCGKKQDLNSNKIMHMSQEEILDNGKEVKLVKGEVNEEPLNWLKRSLVCVSDEPRELDVLQTTLNSNFPRFTKICALGKFKFILSCETEEEMKDILENHQEIDNWFHSIRKWNNSETCAIRRTWIVVFGVPPQAWTRKNFGSIVKHWGTFVSLGKVLLSIEDSNYRVFVKEKGSEVHIIHQGKPPEPWDPNSSDLEDSMNSINQNRDTDDMDRQVAKFDYMANANDDMDAVEESHELGDGSLPK
ncbi:hypothetical protein Cgig2_027198 [Carnegiea gigantea]|uniref:RRM domain-containing protein n=1 Tax=Carnegiea gigantea TaxID=171969 RepID=A0A9Q1KUR9_9CARY|nr:hypothetical protein Cgig2_027198 [Carnegiea gigantea]